jgi:SAM-dependent methyltransferase
MAKTNKVIAFRGEICRDRDGINMKRLTDKSRWDQIYNKGQNSLAGRAQQEGLITGRWKKYFCSYSDYLLWNVILRKYMPPKRGGKGLEVGSAPGNFLVGLHKSFGLIPYGVEYSEPGVMQNRQIFSINQISPDNVILADFFDYEFHQKFKGYFDVVVSRGFIEHFTDMETVISNHLNVLKEGGILVVSIPNLNKSSIYRAWSSRFDRERMNMYNLDIMSKESFEKIFDKTNLVPLFCDYYGTCRLNVMGAAHTFGTRLVISACCKFQRLLDPMLHIFFGNRGADSPKFSPMLLYIGRKLSLPI